MDQPPSAGRPLATDERDESFRGEGRGTVGQLRYDRPALSRLILASASPRRRGLLARLGLAYDVQPADVDEAPLHAEPPRALALRLARSKAARVAARSPDAIVVAADTVVAMGRTLYGKPDDAEDAARMLRELAGRRHRVITAVAVARGGDLRSGCLTTTVTMRPLAEEEIAAYVASGDPLDKAGAYAVQNEQFRPVAALRGCRCNVVGFPIGLVAALLREAGVEVPAGPAEACPYRRFSPARCCPRPA